jgi:N-acyl amino acid synthase of PEP-CTERM/exosortase system
MDESLFQTCLRALTQQTFHQFYWKTFRIEQADTDEQRKRVFHLRYQVFCEDQRFGHTIDNPALIEKDSYDDRAIHHLLIHSQTNEAVGTVRVLLPRVSDPSASFEIQNFCKHPLLADEERAQHLCEISRLCMSWNFRRRPGDGRFLPAYSEQEPHSDLLPHGQAFLRRRITYAPLGLISAAFETAMDRGLLNCVSLLDPADFKSLKRLGLPYKVLGPRVQAHGSVQPIMLNIKYALDNMEAANPECWEIVSDKGRLTRRASEIQLEQWHQTIFDETARAGILHRIM